MITGLSGSGKSSLAFDTLYAEGQRRYVESLSAYARQFLSMMDKPDVDSIEGLSPAIAIEQKATSHNPRSTVGTVTEIYDYLRLLYARAGMPRCPDHGIDLPRRPSARWSTRCCKLPEGTPPLLLAPLVADRKGEHADVLAGPGGPGFRARAHRRPHARDRCAAEARPEAQAHHRSGGGSLQGAAPTPRSASPNPSRPRCGCRTALARLAFLDEPKREEIVFSSRHACPVCGYSVPPLEPKLFSFNSPAGACPACDGLGVKEFFDPPRVVIHPQLSLAGGAIRGWDRRNAYYFQLIQSLAQHYEFDIETPWTSCPRRCSRWCCTAAART